jgi:RNase adaptor protein for sRNA GlmZ degradation
MTTITIVSFGHRHGEQPVADFTADVQRCLRDPLDTHLRNLTGLDPEIRDHVLQTPGAWGIARSLAEAGERLLSNTGQPVVLAFGCGGGRHRAVALAELAASFLRDYDVEVIHRDIDKPVLAPLVDQQEAGR